MSNDSGIRTDVVNLSTVYRDVPVMERFAAAKADGHERVESWWDFPTATLSPADMDALVAAAKAAGVQLTAINSHGGERAAGERGLACLPDRTDEFRASIESVCEVADKLGARKFNVTIGEFLDRWSWGEQFATAAENYRWAAQRVAPFGGTILIEALSGSGAGDYPFRTGRDVVEFLQEHLADVPNIGFLFDAFHLAANGVEILQAWDELHEHVKHVQFADFPGRGAPGTGELPLEELRRRILASSYDGDIALEYLSA